MNDPFVVQGAGRWARRPRRTGGRQRTADHEAIRDGLRASPERGRIERRAALSGGTRHPLRKRGGPRLDRPLPCADQRERILRRSLRLPESANVLTLSPQQPVYPAPNPRASATGFGALALNRIARRARLRRRRVGSGLSVGGPIRPFSSPGDQRHTSLHGRRPLADGYVRSQATP